VAVLRKGRLVVVDSLERLRAIAVRRLAIELAGAAPSAAEIGALPGVRQATLDGAQLDVAYEGSADPLIKALAVYDVRAIRSRDDDLEDLFLHYYRDGEDA